MLNKTPRHGQDVLDRIAYRIVPIDSGKHKFERLCGVEDECRTVSMARHHPIARAHHTEFRLVFMVGTVVRVVEKVDANNSRPVRTETRHDIVNELIVNDVFE